MLPPLELNKPIQPLRIFLGLVLCLAIATPALAGTVYSWETEDGTLSFADQGKKVPKKYKAVAKESRTSDLKNYERYTPAGVSTDAGAYAKRLEKRLEQLRGEAAAEAVATTMAPGHKGPRLSIVTGGSRFGQDATIVPVGRTKGHEPVVIEQKRVYPEDSMATRHVTVIKQGDRVISVRKDEKTQRSYAGVTATGESEEDAY